MGITIKGWTSLMASSSKAANEPATIDPAVIDLNAAHLTLGTAAAKVKIKKASICKLALVKPLAFWGLAVLAKPAC